MTLRTALIIDGDARGGKQAATDTSDAISLLRQNAVASSREIKDALSQAGASGKAANDNIKSSSAEAVEVFGKLLSKVLANNQALAGTAGAATNAVSALATIGRAAGPAALMVAAFDAAKAVVELFHQAITKGEQETKARLEEHARLVGVIKEAYSDAEKKAGEFLRQSKAVTDFQTQQLLLGLQSDLQKQTTTGLVSTIGKGRNIFASEAFVKDEMKPFEDALLTLNEGLQRGTPDVKAFVEEVAKIGAAARAANPEVALLAAGLIKTFKDAADTTEKIRDAEAMLRLLNGTATESDRKLLGLSTSTEKSTNEFDRATKQLERQAAAQEAEARAVGLSVGAQARMRAEMLLLEAAKQADLTLDEKRLATIKALADRLGAATQKAAEARLASDAVFNRVQLGRDPVDASVATQLRNVYGDFYAGQMDSTIGRQLRFNEQLRISKDLITDLGSSFLKDFKQQIADGVNVWEAFSKAGLNALNRLSDKLIDMAVQQLVAKAFGGSGSGGGLLGLLGGSTGASSGPINVVGAAGDTPVPTFFDEGGYTGNRPRHEIAGFVHGQEFVVHADATAQHRPLLQAMNDNRLPGYREGGFVRSLGMAPPQITGGIAVGGGTSINVGGSTVIIQGSADKETLAEIRRELAIRDQELPTRVIAAYREAKVSGDIA